MRTKGWKAGVMMNGSVAVFCLSFGLAYAASGDWTGFWIQALLTAANLVMVGVWLRPR